MGVHMRKRTMKMKNVLNLYSTLLEPDRWHKFLLKIEEKYDIV